MAPTVTRPSPTQFGAAVASWREVGDARQGQELLEALRPELVSLCWDLGLLYAREQSTQAIEAALRLANPASSPSRWRRRNPGVLPAEWSTAPATTFRAVCVHALLDQAGVGEVASARARLPVAHRAALRLQLAQMHDPEDAADVIGLHPDTVRQLWDHDELIDLVTSPRVIRLPSRLATVAGAGLAGTISSLGQALAATFGSSAIAAAAVVVGVVASGVALERGGIFVDDTPTIVVEVPVVPAPSQPIAPAPPAQEGVESPLAPGDERPGLNVPQVEVPTVDLDDLLGPGDQPTTDLPDLLDLPDVPAVPDVEVTDGVLPTDPVGTVQDGVEGTVDDTVGDVTDLLEQEPTLPESSEATDRIELPGG